jgi:hypothetical protein
MSIITALHDGALTSGIAAMLLVTTITTTELTAILARTPPAAAPHKTFSGSCFDGTPSKSNSTTMPPQTSLTCSQAARISMSHRVQSLGCNLDDSQITGQYYLCKQVAG